MILLRDSSPIPLSRRGAVLALGNFDGLHLGHQVIVRETVARARQTGKPAGVLTFEPHPRRLFKPEEPFTRILPLSTKLRMLGAMGIDLVRVIRFTRRFSEHSAEEFICHYLCEQLQVSQVVTGEDFIFGHKRGGNAALLSQQSEFVAVACAPVLLAGVRCSSTGLRQLLAAGDMVAAAELLGREYTITGRVKQGDKRGRELGFPTANIVPAGLFLPALGVYAVQVAMGQHVVNGVANLGNRPTFAGTETRLEVHLLDYAGDLYGQKLDVSLLHRIRGEQKFEGIAALRAQIARDCEQARALLS